MVNNLLGDGDSGSCRELGGHRLSSHNRTARNRSLLLAEHVEDLLEVLEVPDRVLAPDLAGDAVCSLKALIGETHGPRALVVRHQTTGWLLLPAQGCHHRRDRVLGLLFDVINGHLLGQGVSELVGSWDLVERQIVDAHELFDELAGILGEGVDVALYSSDLLDDSLVIHMDMDPGVLHEESQVTKELEILLDSIQESVKLSQGDGLDESLGPCAPPRENVIAAVTHDQYPSELGLVGVDIVGGIGLEGHSVAGALRSLKEEWFSLLDLSMSLRTFFTSTLSSSSLANREKRAAVPG